ncbi:helix-turn-helix domain-containing protein [Nocardia sp. NBC_00511]|uniref:helix-turn-helix domain-containing protein n=1 Tax=Nocardia sp. NBC_00511 TaxID=2903591 RepID=UPI0030DEAB7C
MSGSTVSRLDFGNYMRELRTRAPRSAVLAAANHIGVSRPVIDRLEDGATNRLGNLHINALLEFYNADAEAREKAWMLWEEVRAEEKRAKGGDGQGNIWKAYKDQIAPNTGKFLRLEGAATRVISHNPVILPAMIQTSDYRRALDRGANPNLSLVDLERRIELTAKRQVRLNDSTFHYEALLCEAVFRNRAGGPTVMRAQLEWLAEVGERDNVEIRIVPHSADAHPGLAMQSFDWLEFSAGASGLALPTVVYAEGAIGSVFHEHDEEVNRYRQAIEGIRAVALGKQDTRNLVLEIAKEYAA